MKPAKLSLCVLKSVYRLHLKYNARAYVTFNTRGDYTLCVRKDKSW
jgi:hypothetical protein